jgi:hypothetical protein
MSSEDDLNETQNEYDISMELPIFPPSIPLQRTNTVAYTDTDDILTQRDDVFEYEQPETTSYNTRLSAALGALQTIAQYVDEQNKSGSVINLHIITFNYDVYVHHNNCNTSNNDFITHLQNTTRPSGCTNFTKPNETFVEMSQSLTSQGKKVVSLFLTDGYSTDFDDQPIDKCVQYDIGIGIGKLGDVDMNTVDKISKKSIQHNNKKGIEESIISNLFDNITSLQQNQTIVLYVPKSIRIITDKPHRIEKVTGKMIATKSEQSPIVATCYDDESFTIINVKSANKTLNVAIDVIIVLDISESMSVLISDKHDTDMIGDTHVKPDIVHTDTSHLIRDIDEEFECESVFDNSEEKISLDGVFEYIKYCFDFENIDQFFDETFVFENTSDLVVTADISIATEFDGISLFQTIQPVHDDYKLNLLQKVNKLDMAINKTLHTQSYMLYRSFIHELYSYVKNRLFKNEMTTVMKHIELIDPSHHKYFLLCANINYLFCSISTVSEYGNAYFDHNFDRGVQLSIGICKEVTTVCTPGPLSLQRTCTQSEQHATQSEEIVEKAIIDGNQCCICLYEKKQIVYSCGHLATCKSCNDQYLYGNNANKPSLVESGQNFNVITLPNKCCPICKTNINGYIEINKVYKKCVTSECYGIPMIMHLDCKQITYCEPCWSKQLCVKKTTSKKRKIPRIRCACGEDIHQFVRVHI